MLDYIADKDQETTERYFWKNAQSAYKWPQREGGKARTARLQTGYDPGEGVLETRELAQADDQTRVARQFVPQTRVLR
jgi:hypothetical protein